MLRGELALDAGVKVIAKAIAWRMAQRETVPTEAQRMFLSNRIAQLEQALRLLSSDLLLVELEELPEAIFDIPLRIEVTTSDN